MKIPTTEIGIVKVAPERYFQFSFHPGMATEIIYFSFSSRVQSLHVYPFA
jgi:hypothetical protein